MIEAMLDTNVIVRAMRRGGEPFLAQLRDRGDVLAVSTMVQHELYVGAELSARAAHHRSLIDEVLARLTLFDFDRAAASSAAHVRADLQRRGALIGANDMLIAGHALSLQFKLVTSDLGDFSRVAGLVCEDWPMEDVQ